MKALARLLSVFNAVRLETICSIKVYITSSQKQEI